MDGNDILEETIRFHDAMRDNYIASLAPLRNAWTILEEEARTERNRRIKRWLKDKAELCYNLLLYHERMWNYHSSMSGFWRFRVQRNITFITKPRMPSRRQFGL